MSQVVCGKSGPDSEELSALCLRLLLGVVQSWFPVLKTSPASHKLALQALDSILRTAAADAQAHCGAAVVYHASFRSLVLWWRDFMVHLGHVLLLVHD